MAQTHAAFYAFFRVDGEPDCVAFAKHLIDEQALSIAPGCAFGKCCARWMRMCFAVSEEKLNDALDRLLGKRRRQQCGVDSFFSDVPDVILENLGKAN